MFQCLSNLSIPKKLSLIFCTFFLVICGLLVVSYVGMTVLSDLRAYVGAEGLWSKAQKDAVYHLMRYAIFREEQDHQIYLTYLTVPLGDRQARIELEKTTPDLEVVERAFVAGRNHPDDVAGMAQLFQRFLFISYIREAISIWREGDRHLSELIEVGDQVHQYVLSGQASETQLNALLRRIGEINDQLTPLEDRFSYTLGQGARWFRRVFLGSMFMITGALLLLGLLLSVTIARQLIREIHRLQRAAARIAKGDYSQQIEVDSADEVGALARSFQQMAVQRQKAEAALALRAQELDAANKKLIAAEKMKDNFFATVSHELRTPLTLILSPLESMLAGAYGAFGEQQQQIMRMMHNNVIRLLQMVTGLLDFSKLEAGRMEVHREAIEVVGMTRALTGDFEPMAQRKSLRLHVDAHPDQATIMIDRYLYERIVFNLLSNAIKFTPQGGQVRVALTWQADRLRLSVRDTGIGISRDDLRHLFEKFQQLEGAATRRFEGTGLGLALVKEFSELLEGSVSVDSQPGNGSVFRVDVLAPLSQDATPPVIQSGSSLVQQFAPYDMGQDRLSHTHLAASFKVLIAEDNVELAAYMASLLAPVCHTRIVRDGAAAWAAVRSWHPDLLITDVMMPKWDGLNLCRAIKADPDTASIPVVILTALTHREALLKGWEAGADEYLFKPFHPKELVTRVNSILERVGVRRQAEAAMRVNETRFRRLVESNVMGVMVADLKGNILEANDVLLRLLGYSKEELWAGMLRWDRLTPSEWHQATQRALNQTQINGVSNPFEKEFFRKDGSRVPVLIGRVRLDDQDDRYLAFVLDRSKEKQVQEQMRLIRSQETLLHVVSHDLKEPLRAIENFSDMLQARYADRLDDKGKDFLNRTMHAAVRMRLLLDDILTLSRVRHLAEPNTYHHGEKLIHEALERLQATINTCNARIHVRDGFHPLRVDRLWATQAIYNLVSNALKFTQDAQPPEVEIAPYVSQENDPVAPGQAGVMVRDRGPGVSPKQAHRIFELFQRAVGREVEGTGAGLAIVLEVAKCHGGHAWTRPREGGGAEFIITFGKTPAAARCATLNL